MNNPYNMNMFRFFFLLSYYFLFISIGNGQTGFSKSIDVMEGSDSGFEVEILTDGFIILAGLGCYDQNDCIGLVKTDLNGTVIWKRQHDKLPEDILAGDKGILVYSNNYYVAGAIINTVNNFQMCLLAFNASGELIWEKEYGGVDDENLNYLIRANDNNFLMAGYRQKNNSVIGEVVVMKTDTLGNKIWEKSYNIENLAPSATGLIQLKNGHIIIPYRFCDQNEGCFGIHGSKAGIYCLDGDGNVLWNKTFSDGRIALETIPRLVTIPENRFVLSWSKNYFDDPSYPSTQFPFPPILVCLDSIGNILWEYEFKPDDITDKSILDIISTNNGEIVGVGYDEGFQNYEGYGGWIFKLGPNGELLWENSIPSINSTFKEGTFFSVKETEDKGFVVTGYLMDTINEIPNINNPNIWLVKLDSLGCIEQSICDNSPPDAVHEGDNDYSLNIYPNPANDILNIHTENISLPIVLKLYDTLGRQMFVKYIDKKSTEIDLRGFTQGNYWYLLQQENQFIKMGYLIILE